MAKGKSTYATWYCGTCSKANYITTYNKRKQGETVREKNKFCNGKECRKHTVHTRKDTKS